MGDQLPRICTIFPCTKVVDIDGGDACGIERIIVQLGPVDGPSLGPGFDFYFEAHGAVGVFEAVIRVRHLDTGVIVWNDAIGFSISEMHNIVAVRGSTGRFMVPGSGRYALELVLGDQIAQRPFQILNSEQIKKGQRNEGSKQGEGGRYTFPIR